jgi:hypothetical protein
MNIENPLSPFLIGLLVTLPGLWWTARAISLRMSNDSTLALLLTPGLMVSLWLLAVHLAGLATRHFSTGLILGSLIPAAYGYVYGRRLIRETITTSSPLPWRMVWTASLGTLVILPAVVFWDFFDKGWHLAVTAQILNDVYPPRDLVFGNFLLNYHYGIDTLFAILTALTRGHPAVVMDVVTVLAWWYTLVLFGILCAELFGERAGVLGVVICGFAGGFPWGIGTTATVANALQSFYQVGTQLVNPPVTSYFFQAAWTIGIPLALIILLLWNEFYHHRNFRREILYGLALCLLVLSFSNLTLFLTVSASAFAISILTYFSEKHTDYESRIGLRPVVTIGVTMMLVPFLGGMFSFLQNPGLTQQMAGIIVAPQGIAGSPWNNLQWNLATFGFLLPLGMAGLLIHPRHRGLFILLVVGSLFVLNGFKYERTWDIVKFATVAQIILAISSVGAIVWWWENRRDWSRYLAWAMGGILIAPGLAFHIPFWLNLPTSVPPFEIAIWRNAPSLTAGEAQAISWLRRHISAGDMVLCPPTLSTVCNIDGGFPMLYHPVSWLVGFPYEWIQRRQELFAIESLPVSITPYLNEGVRWAILPAGTEPWETVIRTWVTEGSAKAVVTFETVTVFQMGRSW